MPSIETATSWRGHEMIDRDGDKIGTVTEIYLDEDTGMPEWAAVKTSLFGRRHAFVPIGQAVAEGEIVRVPYEKKQVKGAPTVDSQDQLTQRDEAELYSHYGMEYSKATSGSGLGTEHPAEAGGETAAALHEPEPAGTPGTQGETAAPSGDATPRREGEVDAVERVRLKKYVTTEEVTEETVPVEREEVTDEPGASERDPVVEKRTEP
jgi:sporulation protein YlmC with PRC-barrel domain